VPPAPGISTNELTASSFPSMSEGMTTREDRNHRPVRMRVPGGEAVRPVKARVPPRPRPGLISTSNSEVMSAARCAPRVSAACGSPPRTRRGRRAASPRWTGRRRALGARQTRYPVTVASSQPVGHPAAPGPAAPRPSAAAPPRAYAGPRPRRALPGAPARRRGAAGCTPARGPAVVRPGDAAGPAWTTSPGAVAPGPAPGPVGPAPAPRPALPGQLCPGPGSARQRSPGQLRQPGTWVPAQHTTTSAAITWPAAVRTAHPGPEDSGSASKPVTLPAPR